MTEAVRAMGDTLYVMAQSAGAVEYINCISAEG